MPVLQITSLEELEKQIEQTKGTVLVDFWATWCGPCRMLAPVLEELSAVMEDLVIIKVNVDEAQETALKFEVQSVPMLVLFKNGKEVSYRSGFMNLNGIENWIKTHN